MLARPIRTVPEKDLWYCVNRFTQYQREKTISTQYQRGQTYLYSTEEKRQYPHSTKEDRLIHTVPKRKDLSTQYQRKTFGTVWIDSHSTKEKRQYPHSIKEDRLIYTVPKRKDNIHTVPKRTDLSTQYQREQNQWFSSHKLPREKTQYQGKRTGHTILWQNTYLHKIVNCNWALI